MPRFDLTPTQRRALEALDWLHSQEEEARATGRTTVLVLNLLRRLFLTQEAQRCRGGWLPVSDHVGTQEMDRHLIQETVRVAAEFGFTGFEVHASQIRIRIGADAARIPHLLVEAISVFGDRPEESLGLPVRERIIREPLASGVPIAAQEIDPHRMIREMVQAGDRIDRIRERQTHTGTQRHPPSTPVQAESPPPASSLWDHLTDSDD